MNGRYDPQLTSDEVQKLILLCQNMVIGPGGISFSFGTNQFTMQSDGNVVVYGSNGTPLWYTGTTNS